MHACMHACIHTHTHTYMCMFACVYVCVCVHIADAADAASYTLEYEEFKQAVGKVNNAKDGRRYRREPLIIMNTIF